MEKIIWGVVTCIECDGDGFEDVRNGPREKDCKSCSGHGYLKIRIDKLNDIEEL